MNTSTQQQRRPLHRRSARVLPVVATCALTLLVGCGGVSDGSGGSGGGGGAVESNAPTISGIAPTSGPPGGGTTVTITGEGFLNGVTGATLVTFGGVAATDVVVVDDATVQATTPAGANDLTVGVRVENSRGAATLSSAFTYLSTASIVSDLNSDGVPDLVIAAGKDDTAAVDAGAVYVFFGVEGEEPMTDATTSQADVVILGVEERDYLGTAVVTGDLNADGHTDLVVGAPRADSVAVDAGLVAIFLGPLDANLSLSALDADVLLTGEGTVPGVSYDDRGDKFGQSLALGDRDGDGLLDLLVGAPGADLLVDQPGEVQDGGRAYLFLGGGQLTSQGAADAHEVVEGLRDKDQLGTDVCLVDLDADGLADIAASYDVMLSGPNHQARVAVFTAPVTEATADQASITLTGATNGDRFGFALVCGDLNGDGVEDLFVGAPYATTSTGQSVGRAYAFLGHEGFTSRAAGDADAVYSGQLASTGFATELASADVNGDGYGDLLVGAPFSTAVATWDGQVFAFYGAEQPLDQLANQASVVLDGASQSGERFGSAVEVLDSDADGVADIMSGAAGHASLAGRVHVFNGSEGLTDLGAESDDLTLTGELENGTFGSSISRGR